ncbi:hypothetical protein [Streptomyces sp. SP18BB07]|uniref:hypothetical protein n=1 Tax=Streptomyces sp. SP18BB07 TaxID=3002522 RepID=UPI002E7687D1|nr:hypothetical protein [Streptomyces sp. SP18BB07]MEE1758415.1 hypothetical protein [Streptomyces sp. SP18BB07]
MGLLWSIIQLNVAAPGRTQEVSSSAQGTPRSVASVVFATRAVVRATATNRQGVCHAQLTCGVPGPRVPSASSS